ncbi:hypothetical protein DL96DRAFT_1583022 [Flagelloscypha sp. PMI_526]|nr:hypothetical protein DL96DRAFT_1583022 [Flagelloscypha sp. PMI_526]
MPRGIPNAKRDETGMKWTTFHAPLALNPKHNTSTYLKSDNQSIWARNTLKNKRNPPEEIVPISDQRRGTNVLVIHPGSRFLRVGRASDIKPVSVLSVVARKCKGPVPSPSFVPTVIPITPRADPFVGVSLSLQDRRRYYKLEDTPNASRLVSDFNKNHPPEIIQNDPFAVEWVKADDPRDVIFGEDVLKIGDPKAAGYTISWPIIGGKFNTRRDGPSLQILLSDLETLLRHAIRDLLEISPKQHSELSVVLVVPDLYEKNYLREVSNLLLVTLGFKQLCVQQESMAATYGAGITSACVVNLGGSYSTVACVDEGLVVPESRLSLGMGGDDINQCLLALLSRVNFPYSDMDLANLYDWNILDDLKSKHCSLADNAVAITTYEFASRKPGEQTRKFVFQAYDEMILAPMCLFDIRPIDFENKRRDHVPVLHPDVTDEIIDWVDPAITQAMINATKHLMPNDTTTLTAKVEGPDAVPDSGIPMDEDPLPGEGGNSTPMTIEIPEEVTPASKKGVATKGAFGTGANDVLLTPPVVRKEYGIDVPFEASKLPLDVAIYNSVRAAGPDERMKKYLNAVLVIGGTSLISSMDHALRSRLQGIMGPLFPGIEVQIIPPPKDVDPRVLAWKGAAVLGKMEAANELWVTPTDWDMLGIRGLKERCFYL